MPDCDSENNYHWPDQLFQDRFDNDRPALTINKVRQHNLQVINDAKQKKSGIKFRPIGDRARARAAEVYEGVARQASLDRVGFAPQFRATPA